MKRELWAHLTIVCALLLPAAAGARAGAESAPLDSPPITQPASQAGATSRLYPAQMDPPESCGVPLGGPFGQDVEILLSGVEYELEPRWYSTWYDISCAGCTNGRSHPASDIATTALSTEKIAAVWREDSVAGHEGELYYNIYNVLHPFTTGDEGWLGPAVDGNPAVLSTGGGGWEVYARDPAGGIEYRAWLSPTVFSDWRQVPGTTVAASDPVVVSRRSGSTALFFRDADGGVWFTEREGGVVWRGSPLLLTGYRVFLPMVSKAGTGTAAVPGGGQASSTASLTASSLASPLSAISRNENHLAVFGVDARGLLWVKDWTSRNASDWSDTEWVNLMGGVAIEKPAVASRHSNHLAVAVRDASGVAHVIEWTEQTGWGAPVSLGETFAGPLSLAATDTEEMFLFGLNESAVAHALHWTRDAGWEASGISGASGPPEQVLSAVVRRPAAVMLLMRTAGVGEGWYTGYNSGYPSLHFAAADRDFALPQSEFYRNQALARVGSRSYYLFADEGATGDWKVEAWDLDGDVWQPRLPLAEHPYAAGTPVSVAAGDLDFDGSDEIVVATYNHPTATISVIDLIVVDPDTSPVLSMVVQATISETFIAGGALDLSVAVGDLDGDLRRNDVVLAADVADLSPGDDPLHAVAKLYQFVPGDPAELEEKTAGFQAIADDPALAGWELDLAAGRLSYGYPGEQLAVAITAEFGCPSCWGMGGYVNTYGILAPDDAPWTFDPVDDMLAAVSGDPLEFPGSSGNPYRSAIATGDLDADGYEEIAAWYLDRVFVIDPNDPDGDGNPTGQMATVTPRAPGTSNPPYFQSPRSLALGDLDRDGKAEILAAAYFEGEPYGLGFRLLELVGDDELTITKELLQGQEDQQEGTVLVGDLDGDGLVSELVGCSSFGEYSVVAVVNGMPRWYENGVPVFDSTGSYSIEQGGGSGTSNGTTYNYGASLSIGYESELNIPFVGTVASFRASVTEEILRSSGFTDEREVFTAYGSDYSFDEGLGIVVYNVVPSACYYYDVFRPDNPAQTSRAMSCRRQGGSDTAVMTLEQWHAQATKDAAGWSWVDVGHRAPGGALTNDLLEPGNYRPYLPVDEFLLLFEWPWQIVVATGGASESWYANQATSGARTEFESIEENTTVSVGSTTGGVVVDASATFGMGWENSSTISWSDTIAFAGGYSWAGGGYSTYWVAPYAYQATAETLAGSTYPCWVMDYYVPSIGP